MKPQSLLLAILLLALSSGASAWEPPKEIPFATENLDIVCQEAEKVDYRLPRGNWSFPDENAEVAIVPASVSEPDIYKIVILFDADMLPPRGTVIGYLSPTADPRKWHAWLYSTVKNNTMKSPREFAVTFNFSTTGEEASLIFEKIKKSASWRINPLALIPFVRRIVSVKLTDRADQLPYGLYRRDLTHRLIWL